MERLHILIPLEREAPHSAASRSPVKLAANKSQGRSAISPQRCHVGAAGAVRGCDNGLEVKTAPHSNYTADLSHIMKTSHPPKGEMDGPRALRDPVAVRCPSRKSHDRGGRRLMFPIAEDLQFYICSIDEANECGRRDEDDFNWRGRVVAREEFARDMEV